MLIVFSGPSLPSEIRSSIKNTPSILFLPPVRAGDIWNICNQYSVTKILIIDGYFFNQLSVLHKEILFAIDHGIVVVGAASLGALRASELSNLGMIGIGSIFNYYSLYPITGDDEVAVLHSPTQPFTSYTVPLVNLRILRCKINDNLVFKDDLGEVINKLERYAFHKRTWAIIKQCFNEVSCKDNNSSFELLKSRYIDYKRRDAVMGFRFCLNYKSSFDDSFACNLSRSNIPNSNLQNIFTRLNDPSLYFAGQNYMFSIDNLVSILRLNRSFSFEDISLQFYKSIIYDKYSNIFSIDPNLLDQKLISLSDIYSHNLNKLGFDSQQPSQLKYIAHRELVFEEYIRLKVDELSVADQNILLYNQLFIKKLSNDDKTVFNFHEDIKAVDKILNKDKTSYMMRIKTVAQYYNLSLKTFWKEINITRLSDFVSIIKNILSDSSR